MMETQDLLVETPTYKLYSSRFVRIGSFIGGPLAAGYFIAENYKSFGQTDNARKTWIVTILFTIVLFGLIFLVPAMSNTPNYIIPILYSAVAAYLVDQKQGNLIKNHMANSGTMFSFWRVLLISLIGLAATFAIIFLIILLTDKSIFS